MALKHTQFIEQNARQLASYLASSCANGAKELVDTLGARLPRHLHIDLIFLWLFAVRATIESKGIEQKYGEQSYRTILSAIDDLYASIFADEHLKTGAFSGSLMLDVVGVMQACDLRNFVRVYAVRHLETRDPEHELFHWALTKILADAHPITMVVETNI